MTSTTVSAAPPIFVMSVAANTRCIHYHFLLPRVMCLLLHILKERAINFFAFVLTSVQVLPSDCCATFKESLSISRKRTDLLMSNSG